MKKYCLFSLIILLLIANTGFGQITLRLPRIANPRIEAPNTSSQITGRASNRQYVLDDGFTFFDAEPLQEYSAQARRQVGVGWHLRSYLRMFGTVPNRSGFNVVVSRAGRQLAKIRCEGTAYRKAEDPVPENRRVPEDDYLLAHWQGCEDKTKAIRDVGKLDVQIYFFDGDTDQEKLLRTYKIDVREAKRVRGVATAPVEDVPHYYIQRHAETAAAMLYLRPRGYPNYYRARGDNDFVGEVEIYFSISPQRQVDRIPHPVTRCSVNGTPLRFPGPTPYSDQADAKSMRVETAIYTDRLAPQFRTGPEYKDEVSFNQYRLRLPLLLKGDPANNRLGLQDNKGNWECSFRVNGETIRTFRWTVGNNGNPVPHPEQADGNVNLVYNGYLIEAEVPPGGSPFDHRLAPLPNDGFFYGLPWKSPSGKAAAAKVPVKGRPYHVPSR